MLAGTMRALARVFLPHEMYTDFALGDGFPQTALGSIADLDGLADRDEFVFHREHS
jgi:hypothetical protein